MPALGPPLQKTLFSSWVKSHWVHLLGIILNPYTKAERCRVCHAEASRYSGSSKDNRKRKDPDFSGPFGLVRKVPDF